MTDHDPTDPHRDGESGRRRSYDSPLRRERMAETHERIAAAGAELVRNLGSWDWSDLTFRAVAERAGVGERTVYRHFPTEADLRDAILARLAVEAGVDYERMALDDVAETAARVLHSLRSWDRPPPKTLGPALEAADEQRRHAVARAVAEGCPELSAEDQLRLAASIDVMWGVAAYERLVALWGLAPDDAVEVVTWAIDTLARRPPPAPA